MVIQASIQTYPQLGIVLVGATKPGYNPSQAVQTFLQGQFGQACAFMTFCTGAFPVPHSSILAEKTATAPRGLSSDFGDME